MFRCFQITILTLGLGFMLIGCSRSGIKSENNVKGMPEVVEQIAPSASPAMTPVDNIEESVEGSTEKTAPADDDRDMTETVYGSISEYMKSCDPAWNDSPDYQAAIRAYEQSITREEEKRFLDRNGGPGEARLSFAYIDGDEIPEMLLSIGTFHVVGVNVYTYIPDRDEAVWLGEFSIYGGLTYNEKKNRIKSGHGGQGYYMINYTRISDGRAELVGSVTQDSDGILIEPESRELEPYYVPLSYANYPIPDTVDGSNKDGWPDRGGYDPDGVRIDFPGDEYIVSEEEYNELCDRYFDLTSGDNIVSISYSDMAKVVLK